MAGDSAVFALERGDLKPQPGSRAHNGRAITRWIDYYFLESGDVVPDWFAEELERVRRLTLLRV